MIRILRLVGPFLCPQNQKILSTNYHYGNPSTRFSVEPLFLKVTTFKAIVRGFDTYQFDQQNKISFYFSI